MSNKIFFIILNSLTYTKKYNDDGRKSLWTLFVLFLLNDT